MHRKGFTQVVSFHRSHSKTSSFPAYIDPEALPPYLMDSRRLEMEWDSGTLRSVTEFMPDDFDSERERVEVQKGIREAGEKLPIIRSDPFLMVRYQGPFAQSSREEWEELLRERLVNAWIFWGDPVDLFFFRWVEEEGGGVTAEFMLRMESHPNVHWRALFHWQNDVFQSFRIESVR